MLSASMATGPPAVGPKLNALIFAASRVNAPALTKTLPLPPAPLPLLALIAAPRVRLTGANLVTVRPDVLAGRRAPRRYRRRRQRGSSRHWLATYRTSPIPARRRD